MYNSKYCINKSKPIYCGSWNPEPRTQNQNQFIIDPKTQNPELRTQNPEFTFKSQIFKPKTKPTTNFHALNWTLNATEIKEAQ